MQDSNPNNISISSDSSKSGGLNSELQKLFTNVVNGG